MKSADPEMQSVLREELSGLFDELLALLDQFEDGEILPVDLVRRAFRIFHNAKGALRIGGHSRLELQAHLVEDQLSALRDRRAPPRGSRGNRVLTAAKTGSYDLASTA